MLPRSSVVTKFWLTVRLFPVVSGLKEVCNWNSRPSVRRPPRLSAGCLTRTVHSRRHLQGTKKGSSRLLTQEVASGPEMAASPLGRE